MKIFITTLFTFSLFITGCSKPIEDSIQQGIKSLSLSENALVLNLNAGSKNKFVMPNSSDIDSAQELLSDCSIFMSEVMQDEWRRIATIEELAALSVPGYIGFLERMMMTDGLRVLPIYGDRISAPFKYFGNPTSQTKKTMLAFLEKSSKSNDHRMSRYEKILNNPHGDEKEIRFELAIKCFTMELQAAMLGYNSVTFNVAQNYMEYIGRSNIRDQAENLKSLVDDLE